MNSFTVEIPIKDFDLDRCVSSGQVFRWDRLPDGRWLGVDHDHWFLALQSDDRIEVTSNGIEEDFKRLFRLDESLPQVLSEIIRQGPELEPYIDSLPGLRVLKPTNREEILFAFMCTPNNNMTRIKKMVGVLASYGAPLEEVEGRQLTTFPSAQRIADIPEKELRDQGFGYRAATIPHVAKELLLRGDGWLERLSQGTYEDAHEAFCLIKGIGPKLADCMCLFALHFTESAPVDTHLWQAFCRVYRPEWSRTALTDARYHQVGDFLRGRFGKLTGWAHQYLFYDNALNWRSRKTK